MSLVNILQPSATRQRDENHAKLLQYANEKRIDGKFNDVTIQVGTYIIPGNRLVLSCYSKTFESLFESSTKTEFRVECDGESVNSLIEYMYTSKIKISTSNVMNLLSTADFLEMDDVKTFCFDFFESALTVNNCLTIFTVAITYRNQSPLNKTIQLISENFDDIFQQENFQNLSNDELTLLISKLDRNKVQEISLYKAIVKWVQYNDNRTENFLALFKNLDLDKFPPEFVKDEIAEETLVKNSLDCLKSVVTYYFRNIKETGIAKPVTRGCNQAKSVESPAINSELSSRKDEVSSTGLEQKATTSPKTEKKILCIGGYGRKTVSEVYNTLGESAASYPDLPSNLSHHCSTRFDEFVYCIGGMLPFATASKKVFRMNLTGDTLKWEEVASMALERYSFGAAVFDGKLIGVGGLSNLSISSTVELYNHQTNTWKNLASLIHDKCNHAVAVAGGCLYAIGGEQNNKSVDNKSVERLSGVEEEWEEVQPMKSSREKFAAVNCNGFIYCIGGRSTDASQTVEKYDPTNDEWAYVSSLNVGRWDLAACVLKGKIYVVGGENRGGNVREMECYDPTLDQWTVVGETDKLYCHSIVAL